MIKHHPTSALLHSFVAGELPASLTAAIVMHTDMCPICKEKVDAITHAQASKAFMFDGEELATVEEAPQDTLDFDAMIDDIVMDVAMDEVKLAKAVTIDVKAINTSFLARFKIWI